MKFAWDSSSADVLLNPRLPEAEARRLRDRVAAVMAEQGPERFASHFWVTTSGSTGGIKCVALAKRAVLDSARAVNAHLQSDGRDVWAAALPGFHVGGLGIWARAHLSGARVVDLSELKWDPHAFHRACLQEGVTLTALVPTQVFDLIQAGLAAPASLRATVIGGGALAEEIYAAGCRLGWKLLPSYGLTECCSQVATAALESGSGEGFPPLEVLSHVEARVRDGRIELRSPSLLTGYALETEGRFEFMDPKRDGWFRTEDAGELEGRRLRVLGRGGGFLKIAGESVDFTRLEKIFEEVRLRVGAGAGYLLVALPDARLGHGVWLVREEAAAEACVAGLREGFDRQVLPVERIRGVRTVPRIPRSPLGKVLKQELLGMLPG